MGITLPRLPFSILTASKQLISGEHINKVNGLLTSFQGAVTALAGGGYAGAPTLNAAFVELTTVATGGDSVALPPAKCGLNICVTNSGASSANIFPQPADTINAGAAGAAIALAAAAVAYYTCTKDGVWKRFISS